MTSALPQSTFESNSEISVIPLPDHVMVLLDEETHRQVLASDFLPEQFSPVQTKQADSSIAGQYATVGLAGTDTLLELFCGSMPGPTRYTAGLVFSFEWPGAVPEARRALLEQAGIGAHYQLVERVDPDTGTPQPWYHLLAPDLGPGSPLLVMLNQVTPEYYAKLGARPGPGGELLRRDYLAAALGGEADLGRERMLGDIVGVRVRLRAARADRLSAVLTTLGYRADAGSLHGPEFTVTLDADESAPEGVTEVTMALRHAPAERIDLRFGPESRLVLDPNGTATWSFTPIV
jgi:Family of unknown function (DUF5829)